MLPYLSDCQSMKGLISDIFLLQVFLLTNMERNRSNWQVFEMCDQLKLICFHLVQCLQFLN